MDTPANTLIEKFMSQTLSDDEKREFVSKGATDREFLKQLIRELELDMAIDDILGGHN